jgi:hypothetical protein
MNRFTHLLTALAVLAVLAVAAGPAEDALFSGPVHTNWHAAVLVSGLDLDQPIELTPVAFRKSIALYRLVGQETGQTAEALVALPFDPALVREDEPGSRGRTVAAACSNGDPFCGSGTHSWLQPDSSRCTVSLYEDDTLGGSPLFTNVDWHTFANVGTTGLAEYNDEFSSMKTTCAPVYVYKNANWLGTSLYVPANTTIHFLSAYGFNDAISSMWHVLPSFPAARAPRQRGSLAALQVSIARNELAAKGPSPRTLQVDRALSSKELAVCQDRLRRRTYCATNGRPGPVPNRFAKPALSFSIRFRTSSGSCLLFGSDSTWARY